MSTFKEQLLTLRRVSIWGLGYLGYTSLIMLQSKGISADVHDFNETRINGLKTGTYPATDQIRSWSSQENCWSLDMSKVGTPKLDSLFDNPVHLICFPGSGDTKNGNRLSLLTRLFLENASALEGSLIVFKAAETPGDIEHYCIAPLKNKGINCSFATMFRKDWSIEEFFYTNSKQRVSGHDQESLNKVEVLMNILDMEYDTLSSIKEAEIYECSRKTMNYTISSFVNQITLAYPGTNLKKMIEILMEELGFKGKVSNIGTIGYKSARAIGNLIDGAQLPSLLTLAKDAEHTNLAAILKYANIINQSNLKRVTILGVSQNIDRKDILFSPSIILAEALINEGVVVKLHDPYLDSDELHSVLPKAQILSNTLEGSENDCLVLMTAHRQYRYLTQTDVNRITRSSKLVIDNTGLWKIFTFQKTIQYHIPGDGKIKRVEV